MSFYRVKGKMVKHRLMRKESSLRRHIPETHWFSIPQLRRLLRKYGVVFLKPDRGSGGKGIIRITRIRKGRYLIRQGTRRTLAGRKALDQLLWKMNRSSRSYLVQRGLHLAKYRGRKFDIRMYMQNPSSHWIVSGMAARVAPKRLVVTNYLQGGSVVPLSRALRPLLGSSRAARYKIRRCKRLSKRIARVLHRHYPDIRELGIDLAVDRKHRIWIIEANSRPQHKLFYRLPSCRMLRRIRRNKAFIDSHRHG
ncbi:YheC/YheD family protein [Paenibacillus sp. JX-17]|uniref:YheC/YheD family protein n=1 Tax=Paenibacillus lacisoli TaxID=3064525 RepID=A0ABT9C8N1_9BACL|nr:YheC/YheD family protein [Paenibacillus sp. JX-17]MDO7905613.1 YheC/YheD family protein [Paenibacillus sp. JX-17]